ncbi:hypothetical protein IP88_07940 [alpha proteobacterium AAP81b]|nr:hypothetical protein IP88_07940 [alpha proteobacterium AAP81b]
MTKFLFLAFALASPLLASTPAAWQRGNAAAARACLKAADLRQGEIAAGPLLFSDAAGKTAYLVRGRWRPAHMKGASATMLCLYDRARRTAEATEAKGWTAR